MPEDLYGNPDEQALMQGLSAIKFQKEETALQRSMLELDAYKDEQRRKMQAEELSQQERMQSAALKQQQAEASSSMALRKQEMEMTAQAEKQRMDLDMQLAQMQQGGFDKKRAAEAEENSRSREHNKQLAVAELRAKGLSEAATSGTHRTGNGTLANLTSAYQTSMALAGNIREKSGLYRQFQNDYGEAVGRIAAEEATIERIQQGLPLVTENLITKVGEQLLEVTDYRNGADTVVRGQIASLYQGENGIFNILTKGGLARPEAGLRWIGDPLTNLKGGTSLPLGVVIEDLPGVNEIYGYMNQDGLYDPKILPQVSKVSSEEFTQNAEGVRTGFRNDMLEKVINHVKGKGRVDSRHIQNNRSWEETLLGPTNQMTKKDYDKWQAYELLNKSGQSLTPKEQQFLDANRGIVEGAVWNPLFNPDEKTSDMVPYGTEEVLAWETVDGRTAALRHAAHMRNVLNTTSGPAKAGDALVEVVFELQKARTLIESDPQSKDKVMEELYQRLDEISTRAGGGVFPYVDSVMDQMARINEEQLQGTGDGSYTINDIYGEEGLGDISDRSVAKTNMLIKANSALFGEYGDLAAMWTEYTGSGDGMKAMTPAAMQGVLNGVVNTALAGLSATTLTANVPPGQSGPAPSTTVNPVLGMSEFQDALVLSIIESQINQGIPESLASQRAASIMESIMNTPSWQSRISMLTEHQRTADALTENYEGLGNRMADHTYDLAELDAKFAEEQAQIMEDEQTRLDDEKQRNKDELDRIADELLRGGP